MEDWGITYDTDGTVVSKEDVDRRIAEAKRLMGRCPFCGRYPQISYSLSRYADGSRHINNWELSHNSVCRMFQLKFRRSEIRYSRHAVTLDELTEMWRKWLTECFMENTVRK